MTENSTASTAPRRSVAGIVSVRTARRPRRSATRTEAGLAAWGSEHTWSSPRVAKASVQRRGGRLGGVAPTPDRGVEAPAHLDRGQHLRQERRDRQAGVAHGPAAPTLTGEPAAEPAGVPVGGLRGDERSRLLGREAAPVGEAPHLRLGEHRGQDRLVARPEPPQVQPVGGHIGQGPAVGGCERAEVGLGHAPSSHPRASLGNVPVLG